MGILDDKQDPEAMAAARQAIEAQTNGEPLPEIIRKEMAVFPVNRLVAIRDEINEVIGKYDGALELVNRENPTESNFGFYIDGYTLRSTDIIGEFLLTAPDGRQAIVKSSVFVQFFERRLPVPQ